MDVARVKGKRQISSLVFAILIVATCTVIGLPLREKVAPISLTMIYLTGVVIAAARLGIWPSICASTLSVLSFNFFFTKPYHSFEFYDNSYYFTFSVMLVTSLIVGSMTARLSELVKISRKDEQEARNLFDFANQLANIKSQEEMLDFASNFIANCFDALVTFETASDQNNIVQNKAVKNRIIIPIHHDHKSTLNLVSTPNAIDQFFTKSEVLLHQTYASLISSALSRALAADSAEMHQIEIENERLRNLLLSSISHDLRTPLTIMNGTISNLFKHRKSLPREVVNELTSLWKQSERLQKFVSNLLRMASISSGKLALNREIYTIQEIIGAAIIKIGNSIGGRKIINTVIGQIPLINVDGALIEQVVFNILDNAVQHTSDNGIIELKLSKTSRDITVCIEDNGVGIDIGQEELIFEKFQTKNREPIIPSNGTGLGLAICKGIIVAHGGKITASNNTPPNRGAKFQFTLPIAKNQVQEDIS